MSKRLQVLLEPAEYGLFQKLAKASQVSLGEWVRRALRNSAYKQSERSAETKLKSINRALKFDGPTAEIDEMLEQIDRGYYTDMAGDLKPPKGS